MADLETRGSVVFAAAAAVSSRLAAEHVSEASATSSFELKEDLLAEVVAFPRSDDRLENTNHICDVVPMILARETSARS
ncbi:MAG: hypothetical protein M3N45_12940 [Actinomycetota bacterium]|nr:hypothetical protein [Actinomycetota bacterium]